MKARWAAGMIGLMFWMPVRAADIPLSELDFVDRMQVARQSEIVEKLGDPARAVTLVNPETGEVHGAIWHYRYLNTNIEGEYYPVTELDFVGDRVVMVVFSNRVEGLNALHDEVDCHPSC